MSNWEKVLVSPDTPIQEAIRILDSSGMQIVLIVDEQRKLLGTVTDGDVRRGLLKGVNLASEVRLIMNPRPHFENFNAGRDAILSSMSFNRVRHVPLVDDEGSVVELETLDNLIRPVEKTNWVVLMAGGLGSRLRPLTENCPKPMLLVGKKPLLETIIESYIESGFRRFYISVNYMAEVVMSYFGDGSAFGVEIRYLQETERLGTAGALSLLPERPTEPFFVMNGDLLTKVNFNQLLDFHVNHAALATMCVREYAYQVPYGVVDIEQHYITAIKEKPTQNYFVNAGIYVLDPGTLDMIERGTFFDMPTLFNSLIDVGRYAMVFPLREYWLDVGQIADYERANWEYQSVFA